MKGIKIKGVFIIILALLLAVTAGCSSAPQWAFRYDGMEISAGMYNYFLIQAMATLEQMDYDAHADDSEYTAPSTKQLLKQTTDGMNNSDWVKKEAATLCAAYFEANGLFDRYGLVIDENERASMGSYADYIMSYSKDLLEKNGVGRNSVYEYELNELKKERIFLHLYSEGGERTLSDDELRNVFQRKYAKVEYMYMYMEDADKAAGYFERYKNGEKIEDIKYEYDSTDNDTAERLEDGGATSILEIASATSDVSKAIVSAEIGVPGMVEDENYIYIYTRFDVMEDPADFEDYKENLIYSEKFDEFNDWLREQAAGINLETNQSVIKSYTPEKLKAE